MKIVIFSPTSTEINIKQTIGKPGQWEQPLGGADTALLKMCVALGQVHQVTAYIPIREAYHKGNISLLPYRQAYSDSYECDVLINYRKIYALPRNIKAKKKIFYSQDLADTPCFSQWDSSIKEYLEMFDKIIVLSEYHLNDLASSFNIEKEKFVIIGNAADEQPLEECEKKGNQFIYASTPYRGLVVLMKMWGKIKERIPDAELHVYSSMKIYGSEIADEQFKKFYDKLRAMPGVTYHGSQPRYKMLEKMKECKALLFPSTYPETYCNVVMEARACRTPQIVTDLGNLSEISVGAKVDGNPYSQEYQEHFIKAVEIMNADFDFIKECYPIRTWSDYAKEMLEVVK